MNLVLDIIESLYLVSTVPILVKYFLLFRFFCEFLLHICHSPLLTRPCSQICWSAQPTAHSIRFSQWLFVFLLTYHHCFCLIFVVISKCIPSSAFAVSSKYLKMRSATKCYWQVWTRWSKRHGESTCNLQYIISTKCKDKHFGEL